MNMKKILLALIAVFLMSNFAQATHMLGGEVRWVCLPNGKFIFFLDIYKDCSSSAAGFNFVNQTLDISGSPSPGMSQIVVKPDSNRWTNANNGDITPKCQNPNGLSYSCANGDNGAVQWFPFQSDPITLTGTPPASGWTFKWGLCCRPPVVNLVSPQSRSMGLRATMYRIPNPNGTTPAFLPVNVCQDSSPEFAERPANQICRGYEFTYNHNARDNDLDSLVYSFDDPIDNNFAVVPFLGGYSAISPLPDQNFNSQNIPVTLNPLTGEMKQGVYNGSGASSYNTVIRVDAWRCGQVIASIWRDIPFVLFDCAPLPSGKINNPPQILIDGQSITNYSLEVFAGEKIKIGFQSVDNDLNPTFSPPFQSNTLEPTGFLFSKNFANDQFCETPIVAPCATLTPPPVQTPGNPYQLTQLSGVATEFNWQTDCNHISVNAGGQCGNATGVAGATDGIFNFVMKTYDDNCPLRSINYPTISVKVKGPIPLINPIVKGASIELNGQTTINWVPPIDSANTFEEYDIQGATVGQNLNPTNPSFLNVQSGVKVYKQDRTFPYIGFPTSILAPFPTPRDYYIRMQAYSGCTGDIPSGWSEPVQVIEVDAVPANANTDVTLTWNRPKPINAATNPDFVYESRTRFYIHENLDAADNANLTDPSAWTIVGNTYGETFSKGSPVCNDYVGYRIEARDTVITYEQGSRIDIPNPKYDTLIFSTFSMVDSVLLKAPAVISPPELDSLKVLANGDVFFKVDLAATPIAGTYDIFEIGNTTALGTITAPNSTFTHTGANAVQGNPLKQYMVIATHLCLPNVKDTLVPVDVMKPVGVVVRDGGICDSVLRLTWNEPIGMVTGGITYKVYWREQGGNYIQYQNAVTNRTVDISGYKSLTSYDFYVVAENNGGDVFTSEVFTYNFPKSPSKERLAPPSIRCVSVLDNDKIRVEWLALDGVGYDTTNIFEGMKLRYREAGSNNWLPSNNGTVPNTLTKSDTAWTFTGLNAQTRQYEFQIGLEFFACGGNADTSSTAQSIFLSVSNTNNYGDMIWNGTGISGLQNFEVSSDTNSSTGYNKPFRFSTPNTTYIDSSNTEACKNSVYYYVNRRDDLDECISQSNIADEFFEDNVTPDGQLLDYVTVSRTGDSTVFVRWSDKSAPDVDSLNFIIPSSTGYTFITGVPFGNSFNERSYSFPITDFNPNDSISTVWVQAVDGCGNGGLPEFNSYSTIFLKAYWNPCDSLVELSWNPYTTFNNGEGVEYRIVYSDDLLDPFGPGNSISNSKNTTTDTTFDFKIEKDFPSGRDYHFYILASQTGSGASNFERTRSNRVNIEVVFEGTPNYTYTHYANVLDDNEVELQVYPDASVSSTIGQYVIYRGQYKAELSPIGSVPITDVLGPTFRYNDYTANTNELSYFYKVVAENKCGGAVDTSNFGRTIHLKVEVDNEALTNTLKWNEYEEWDSTVAYYNVYRAMNNGGLELYEVVPPSENGNEVVFVDDVYSEITAVGDFCYMVEAVQGPVTTDFNINDELDPAISRSNEACVIQEPLFYIPNAFSPRGVNRVFGPQGQFVNWSFYEMIIYNRWGELVYQTNDPTEGWDGKVNGKDPQIGSYVYTIRFIDAEGNERKRKGSVSIIQ